MTIEMLSFFYTNLFFKGLLIGYEYKCESIIGGV